MKRQLALGVGTVVTVGVIVACSGRAESGCKVDTECPQGSICRDERCGPASPDASTPTPIDAGSPTCSSDGLLCTTADECCSRSCTSGRCGSSAPTIDPTCRGLYELCQNDCCSGLTCMSGACR